MKKLLKIELKSDLCAASGSGLGSLIDCDICYDNYGFPYIPSKRIKGLLKEACVEYTNDKNIVDNLFGKENGSFSSDLIIDNAYLKDIDLLISEIESSRYKKYFSKERILRNYTSIRHETSIDKNGVAMDNSLRTIRLIDNGLIFYSIIESTNIELIEKIIKLVTHMGLNRNRGYGEVKLSLEEYKEPKLEGSIIYDDERDYNVSLLLKTKSNVIVTRDNVERTEDYITGSSIMGSIATKYIKENGIDVNSDYINLFLNGSVKYGNAYISNKVMDNFYPVPLSYSRVKGIDGEYYDKCFEFELNQNKQLKGIKNKYVNGSFIKSVNISEIYHHRVRKNGADGELYFYSSIDRNQYFKTTIRAKGSLLNKIDKYMLVNDEFRIGKSRHNEYGRVLIVDKKIEEISQFETSDFEVLLASSVILFDKDMFTYSGNQQVLINEIKKVLKIDDDPIKKFISYNIESGYNSLWNLPKEQVSSYELGSVLRFKLDKSIKLNSDYYIGERLNEGYGHLKIINIEDKNEILNFEKELVHNDKNTDDKSSMFNELLSRIVRNLISDELKKLAVTVSKIHNNSSIGRILLMHRESSDYNDFMKRVESIKDVEKRNSFKKVFQLDLNRLSNYDLYKQLSNNDIDDELRLEYIKYVLLMEKIGDRNE